MKVILLAGFLFLFLSMKAQDTPRTDSASYSIDSSKRNVSYDTLKYDSTHDMYGDLLNDDPQYNPRYKWYIPATRVIMTNVFNWATAKYIFHYDWPATSISDWKNNLKKGWEWDSDKFGVNFIGHPHSGNYYFNVGRSNGYTFWGSLPFAIEGSLTWEYFGENTRPSINDFINTPISGMFLGEIIYRISSNILDDRTRGAERVWREIFAGIINPPRALNRLTQGKMFRVTSKEVYQKEPLNITFFAGVHKVNNKIGKNNLFGTGTNNAIVHLQLDYGDPFETRHRKPFDLFRLRIELGYGADVHVLDNVNGYGILFGKNFKPSRLLGGVFQHFDYWRNNIFEVGSLGYGGGLISRIPVKRHSNIYSSIHLAVVPLAGNNTQFGPDTSEFRHYNFGGGMEAKMEETFNLNNWATLGFTGFYYWIHTYNGLPGNSLVGILKPVITVKLYKNLRIGFEQLIYHNDRFLNDIPTLHLTRTEQKLFLQLYFEDPQRRGKYN
ncbi:MAG: DUF3943 domain-containing protein [Bacteroidetes bacterium]|nr:MAG: DUF3943 domain-containing protein [Bacteroidota bacterium]